MSTVKIDIVDGDEVRRGPGGYEAVRIAHVSGITGTPSSIMYSAVLACPSHGSAHPSIPGIYLDDTRATAIGFDYADVTLVYRSPLIGELPQLGQIQKTLGASLQSTTTQRDADGNAMELFYSPTDEEVENGEMLALSYKVVGTANIQVPQLYARYVVRATADPFDDARAYVGRINSDVFLGDPAKFWMCNLIDGDDQGDGTWVNVYEFIRANDPVNGWDVTLISEKDGKPMAATRTVGIHIKTFQIYPAVPFSPLGFS